MGRLAGGPEGFADLLPGEPVRLAGPGHLGPGEAFGGGGDTSGGDGKEEMPGRCRPARASSRAPAPSLGGDELVHRRPDGGVGCRVRCGCSSGTTAWHHLRIPAPAVERQGILDAINVDSRSMTESVVLWPRLAVGRRGRLVAPADGDGGLRVCRSAAVRGEPGLRVGQVPEEEADQCWVVEDGPVGSHELAVATRSSP